MTTKRLQPPSHKPPAAIPPGPQIAPHPKPGLISQNDFDKKKDQKRQIKRIIASPCNRPPATPEHVRMVFHVREQKTHLEFAGKIRWDEVSEDTEGFEIGTVDRYEVEWRAFDKQGKKVPQEDHYDQALVSATNPTGTIYEFKTKGPNSTKLGKQVIITGCTPPQYNGTWTVTAHPDADDDGRLFRVQGNTGGLANASDVGRVEDTYPQTHVHQKVKQPLEKAQLKLAVNSQLWKITAATNPGSGSSGANTFRYTTSDNFTFLTNATVVITGCKPSYYNGTFVATKVDATHFEVNGGSSGHSAASATGTVQGAAAGTTIFTFQTNKPHNQMVGADIRITKCKHPQNYNGTYTITKIVDATTLEVDGDDNNVAPCADPGTLADADDSMFVLTGQLMNPKVWAWQARVRARAGEGCWSSWSNWNPDPPVTPWTGSDDQPPSPDDLILRFDNLEHGRTGRLTAVVSFTEVGWKNGVNVGWDVPPHDDHESDVDKYFVKLEHSKDSGLTDPWKKIRGQFHAVSEDEDDKTVVVRFPGIKPNFYYRARARTYDLYNRKSTWSFLTAPISPTDVKPPPPVAVTALRQVDAVAVTWDDPEEDDTDNPGLLPLDDPPDHLRLPSPQVEYYQVELALDRNFDQIIKQWRRRAASGIVRYETVHYQRRYFWRVRSVNESLYKSGWAYSAPRAVRPAQTKAARTVLEDKTIVPSQVDLVGSFPLAGGLSNQAYLSADANPGWAVLEGEAADGELIGEIITGHLADRIYGGMAFRFQDANNYLFFGIYGVSSGVGYCAFGRVQGGVLTPMSTVSAPIDAETTFVLRVLLDDANITCYLDGVQKVVTTSTLFMNSTKHGWVTRRGTSYDNGEMRFDEIQFTPTGETEPSISDNFDRLATEIIVPPPVTGDQQFRGLMALSGMDGTGTGGGTTTIGRWNMSLVFTQTVTT